MLGLSTMILHVVDPPCETGGALGVREQDQHDYCLQLHVQLQDRQSNVEASYDGQQRYPCEPSVPVHRSWMVRRVLPLVLVGGEPNARAQTRP